MLEARVQIDTKSLEQDLDDVQRKAVAVRNPLAINRTAQRVKAAEEAEVKRVFDRPTSRTTRGLFMQSGSKAKPEARVFLRTTRPAAERPRRSSFCRRSKRAAETRSVSRSRLRLSGYSRLDGTWCPATTPRSTLTATSRLRRSGTS